MVYPIDFTKPPSSIVIASDGMVRELIVNLSDKPRAWAMTANALVIRNITGRIDVYRLESREAS